MKKIQKTPKTFLDKAKQRLDEFKKMITIDFRKMYENREFKAEIERLTPEFQIKSAFIAKRMAKNLTQAQVANLSGIRK